MHHAKVRVSPTLVCVGRGQYRTVMVVVIGDETGMIVPEPRYVRIRDFKRTILVGDQVTIRASDDPDDHAEFVFVSVTLRPEPQPKPPRLGPSVRPDLTNGWLRKSDLADFARTSESPDTWTEKIVSRVWKFLIEYNPHADLAERDPGAYFGRHGTHWPSEFPRLQLFLGGDDEELITQISLAAVASDPDAMRVLVEGCHVPKNGTTRGLLDAWMAFFSG